MGKMILFRIFFWIGALVLGVSIVYFGVIDQVELGAMMIISSIPYSIGMGVLEVKYFTK